MTRSHIKNNLCKNSSEFFNILRLIPNNILINHIMLKFPATSSGKKKRSVHLKFRPQVSKYKKTILTITEWPRTGHYASHFTWITFFGSHNNLIK
jgi:hypothetical protein